MPAMSSMAFAKSLFPIPLSPQGSDGYPMVSFVGICLSLSFSPEVEQFQDVEKLKGHWHYCL